MQKALLLIVSEALRGSGSTLQEKKRRETEERAQQTEGEKKTYKAGYAETQI